MHSRFRELVALIPLAAMLAACGSTPAVAGSYVSGTSQQAAVFELTQIGNSLSGVVHLVQAAGSPPSVQNQSANVGGTVSGSNVQLNVSSPLLGSSRILGTISGSTLSLNIPQVSGTLHLVQFRHATLSQFNTAVAKVHQSVVTEDQLATKRQVDQQYAQEVAASKQAAAQQAAQQQAAAQQAAAQHAASVANAQLQSIATAYPVGETAGPVTTGAGTFGAVLHAASQYAPSTLDIYSQTAGAWHLVGSLVSPNNLQQISMPSMVTAAHLTGGSTPDFVASTAMASNLVTAVAADINGTWELVPFSPGEGIPGQTSSRGIYSGTVQGNTVVSAGAQDCASCATVGAGTYQYSATSQSFVLVP